MYPSLCLVPLDPYEAPKTGNEYLISIIAGVVVVAVVALVSVVLITHIVTKRFTKKKLQKPSCQPSDDSLDSCEVRWSNCLWLLFSAGFTSTVNKI